MLSFVARHSLWSSEQKEAASRLRRIVGLARPEQQQRLRTALAQAGIDGGGGEIRFTRPHLSLEELYLRTVQAQADLASKNPPGK